MGSGKLGKFEFVAIGIGLLFGSALFEGTLWAQADAPTYIQKAETILEEKPEPKPSIFFSVKSNHPVEEPLVLALAQTLYREEVPQRVPADQILRIKEHLCFPLESRRSLDFYQKIAHWQFESGYVTDAQRTLRDAIGEAKRMRAYPPLTPPVTFCGSFLVTDDASEVAVDMLKVGSSDEDVLDAVAQIEPNWKWYHYNEAPYHIVAAQQGRWELAEKLVQQISDDAPRAMAWERLSEEYSQGNSPEKAKVALQKSLRLAYTPIDEAPTMRESDWVLRGLVQACYLGEREMALRFGKIIAQRGMTQLGRDNFTWLAKHYLQKEGEQFGTLDPISDDHPKYRIEIYTADRLFDILLRIDMPHVAIASLDLFPADEPQRFKCLADWYWRSKQEEYQHLRPSLARAYYQSTPFLDELKAGNKISETELTSLRRQVAEQLGLCGMLEEFRDRFTDQEFKLGYNWARESKEVDYPDISLRRAIDKATENHDLVHYPTSTIYGWMKKSRNLTDLGYMLDHWMLEHERTGKDLTTSDHRFLAEVHYRLGDYQQSESHWKQAIESANFSLDDNNAVYHQKRLLIDTTFRGYNLLARVVAKRMIDELWETRKANHVGEQQETRFQNAAMAKYVLERLPEFDTFPSE